MENLPTSSIFVTLQIILLYMFLGVCVMFILILEINLLLVVMSVLFVGYPYGKKGWGVLDSLKNFVFPKMSISMSHIFLSKHLLIFPHFHLKILL